MDWKITFNVSKFAILQFHSGQYPINESTYSMWDSDIPVRYSHKDLGIILTSDLSWTNHYDYVLAKAYGKLSLVRNVDKPERLQRRATKYILDDYQSDYKAMLTKLKLLPLMMIYELNDVLFFVSNCKEPTSSLNIWILFVSITHIPGLDSGN